MGISSTPSLSEFYPHVPYQAKVIDHLSFDYDYSLGIHEILLSGSVGSAKSALMAYLAIRHCIDNPGAKLLLGRRAMPDLKETIYRKILEMMDGSLVEGVHYSTNETIASIKFRNGSEIISRSWADKSYKKMRSLELSAAVIEELTENDEEDKQAYDEIKMRVGRLPHIKKSFIISATNPADPGHWAYKYFIESTAPTRHVYYSVTTDNPFLPESYVEQLKTDLDPKLARRMIYGEWISIESEVIYYAYDKTRNYIDGTYSPIPNVPVYISFDFNIGEGKPISAIVGQKDLRGVWHWFGEAICEGLRTADICEELLERGYLSYPCTYRICGDATGRHRDTRNKKSDWDIVEKFMSDINPRLNFMMQVPLSNPAIRTRHSLVNGACLNANGEVRLYVYKTAPTIDEGLRLTQLAKGGRICEDDTKRYQHCTTALGYALVRDKVLSTNHTGTVIL